MAVNTLKYLNKYMENLPQTEEQEFQKWMQNKGFDLLEEYQSFGEEFYNG